MSDHGRRPVEPDALELVELRRKWVTETSYLLWEAAEFTGTAVGERTRNARLGVRCARRSTAGCARFRPRMNPNDVHHMTREAR